MSTSPEAARKKNLLLPWTCYPGPSCSPLRGSLIGKKKKTSGTRVIQLSFENQWWLGILKSNKFGIQELPLVSARNEKGEKFSKGNSDAFLRMGLRF